MWLREVIKQSPVVSISTDLPSYAMPSYNLYVMELTVSLDYKETIQK